MAYIRTFQNRTSRSSPPPRPKSGELDREKSSDELNEYSSDEARLRRRSSGSESDSDMMGPKVPDNLGEARVKTKTLHFKDALTRNLAFVVDKF